jgi:hypothetical protein
MKGTIELERSMGQIEELCRSEKKTLVISSRRPCVFEGQSPKELVGFRELCQASTQVLWALRDTSSNWTRSIPTCTSI